MSLGKEADVPGRSPGLEELDFVRKAVEHERIRSQVALARSEGEIRRLRAEVECLQIVQQRFESIVDTVPCIIFACNAKGDLTYINNSFTRLTGRPPDTAYGDGWQSFTHPDDVAEAKRALGEAIQSGIVRGVNLRMRAHGEDSYLKFSATGAAVRDRQGKFLEWYGMLIPEHQELHRF